LAPFQIMEPLGDALSDLLVGEAVVDDVDGGHRVEVGGASLAARLPRHRLGGYASRSA
jgi:hypothetical protein